MKLRQVGECLQSKKMTQTFDTPDFIKFTVTAIKIQNREVTIVSCVLWVIYPRIHEELHRIWQKTILA